MLSLAQRTAGRTLRKVRNIPAVSSAGKWDAPQATHLPTSPLIPAASAVRFYTLDAPGGGGRSGGGGGGSRPSVGGLFSMSSRQNNDNADVYRWPVTKMNTVANICPQGFRILVERFGKLHTIHGPGIFFSVPLVDTIAYVVDMRERALEISPQAAITKDNVSVEVSGNVFLQFTDASGAAYGARNPLASTMTFAQSVMRSAIGEMELDEILHGRAKLNGIIKGTLQEAAAAWGIDIRRYEITEVTPDEQIRMAMDKQAAAERTRRELVLQAEGQKRRAELTSEGVKITLQNESEGMLIKIRNEADANRTRVMMEAEGEAKAIRATAAARADAIEAVAAQLEKAGGADAARLALAREYVEMYGKMGSKSNTIMMNERPADVNALMGQVAVSLGAVNASMAAVGNELGEKKLLEPSGEETRGVYGDDDIRSGDVPQSDLETVKPDIIQK